MFKRMIGVGLLALALGACGVRGSGSGGGVAPALIDTPTIVPTKGVADLTIPPPPNGVEVKQGDDPTIDMVMSTMDTAMQQSASENNITVDKQTIFKSSDTPSIVEEFYKTEMKDRGWEKEGIQIESGMTVLTYQSNQNGVIILVMDGSLMMMDGTIVYTLNGTEQ